MKKLITSLLIGASALSGFARQGGMTHEWSGMINTGQHMNTSSITSDENGNIFLGTWNVKGNADLDLTATSNLVNFGATNGSTVISYAPDKSFRWSKSFTSESRISNVTIGQNGEVIVTGGFQGSLVSDGTTLLTGAAGKWNGFVVKLDKDGKYIDGIAFNSGNAAWIYGAEVDATSGDIYVTGYSIGTLDLDVKGANTSTITSSTNDGFTVKYNSSLEYQWASKNIGSGDVQNRTIAQDANYIFVGGNHKSGNLTISKVGATTNDFNTQVSAQTGHVIVLEKATGNFSHFENFGATTSLVKDIEVDGNKLIVAGDYTGDLMIDNQKVIGSTERYGFVSKLDMSPGTGDLLVHNWTKSLYHRITSSFPIALNDVGVSPVDGSLYIGITGRAGVTSRLHKNGTSDAAEVLYSQVSHSNNDAVTVLLDKDAKLLNVSRFGNNSNSLAQNTHITNNGELVMGGWFRAATDFDASAGTITLNGGNFNSIFLAKYSVLPVTHRIYVDDNKNGNGTSWNNPFSTITSAFSVAEAGDTILVAEGTYGALTANKNVKLWGGYVGNETDLMMRDAQANQTIIDGNSALHALTISSPNLVIDGFVITGGKQTASGTGNNVSGAGVFYSFTTGNGDLTIKNCDIKNNQGFSQGGGLYVNVEGTGTFNVKVTNTHIRGNNCRYAPAWLAKSLGSSTLNFDFVNNLVDGNFSKNQTSQWTGFKAAGGGMISGFGTSTLNANIINSTITNNTYQGTQTSTGNALICVSQEIAGNPNVSLNVYNSILFGNESTTPIGYWESGSYEKVNNLMMRNNITEVTTPNGYALVSTSIVNNSNTDPEFIDASASNYTLKATSSAIDAGDVTGIENMIVNPDLAGKERIAGTKIDLGAYEANSNPLNTFDIEEGSVSVYPNPTSSTLNIEANNLVSVEITNTNGQVVLTATENTIDVSGLVTGLYILHIQTENGVYSTKVIKK